LIEKVAERVSIKALFTLTGKLQLPYKHNKITYHWGYQHHQQVLDEKHTIASFQHQHRKIQSIVYVLRILGTFQPGNSSKLLNMIKAIVEESMDNKA